MAKMNVRLLRRVKKHILDKPKRLDMSIFLMKKEVAPNYYNYPQCGTVACVAGWACTLSGDRNTRPSEIEDRARQLLGLTERQANILFYSIPNNKAQSVGLAKAVARQIDTFIATKGRTVATGD